MAYTPIIQVNITIADVQVSTQGFGTPLFITAHREHENRVEEYTSAQDVADVYGDGSDAALAATQVFSQQPSVTSMKIGRRDASISLSIINIVDSETMSIDITNSNGITETFTVTPDSGGGLGTEQEIAAQFASDINASVDISADCTATEVGGQLNLEGTDATDYTSWFTISNLTADKWGGEDNWVGREPASSVFGNCLAEDSDFYFVTCDTNERGFVQQMAAAVQTVQKLYFVADSNTDNIDTISEPDNSLFGTLAAANYLHTVTLYHQDADDSTFTGQAGKTFPECAWVGANAPYDAGSVTWANITLTQPTPDGMAASTDPRTGRRLTTTQKSNLNDRNSNYLEYDAGNTYTRYGQTCSNEWIDTVRGVHWQEANMTSELKALLLGQKGGKVTFDDQGIARVREVIATSLQRGVNRSFLSSYTINMPRAADFTGNERASRILNNVTFQAVLAGAIHEVTVQGTVTNNLNV